MTTRFLAWRSRMTPFAYVTTMAALVITFSGLIDVMTPAHRSLGSSWTWVWTLLSLLVAAVPVALADRFPKGVALAGCYLFFAVTAFEIAVAERSLVAANNLVLYPMVACYTGWFFVPWVSRATVTSAFALSGAALLINPYGGLLTTWVNLALVAGFCLESAGYLRRKLDREIQTDPLTGAMNRSGLDARIGQEIVRAGRTGQTLALVLLDLDDFKLVNDLHGHSAGDRMLTGLVSALRQMVRPYDVIARVGGDEFMVLLPGVDGKFADDLLRRLRMTTGDTWSFGIAFAGRDDSTSTLIDRADQDLYAKKRKRKDIRTERAS